MTRLTPSDQAGTGSAPGSATIPPQRSPRSLRLLVLGASDSAAALRARAAEAGAELAQRFSSRVTHVVVDDTVGEDDARVVRARTAGLPVLDPEQGAQLLGGRDEAVEAGAVNVEAAQVEMGEAAVAQAETVEGIEAVEGVEAVDEVSAEVVAVEEAEQEEAAWDAAELLETEEAESIALVRPRSEYVVQPSEDGPTNVFAGSALEAVLLFPPLPADESVPACGCGEVCGGEGEEAFGGEAVGGEGVRGEAVRGEGIGDEGVGGESLVGVGVGGGAGVEVVGMRFEAAREEDFAAGVDVAGVMAGDVVLGPDAPALDGGVRAASAQTAGAAAGSVAWALVPLASLGLLTPVAMGYAAYRLRSRPLAGATAWYALAVTAAFAVSAAAPRGGGPTHSAVSDLLTACLATSWLGGTVHSFLIRRRVFG